MELAPALCPVCDVAYDPPVFDDSEDGTKAYIHSKAKKKCVSLSTGRTYTVSLATTFNYAGPDHPQGYRIDNNV